MLLDNGNCHINAACINSIGNFDCECKEGWSGNGTVCEGLCHGLTYIILVFAHNNHFTSARLDICGSYQGLVLK